MMQLLPSDTADSIELTPSLSAKITAYEGRSWGLSAREGMGKMFMKAVRHLLQ